MGTPIKDRGIRWVETYGDKSAHLKQEFEAQVGQGSYFRWEGHDSTTGTDYYVVVSPGYSKEHGYHFFAGLRKMPADQGASGKKFNTQREAMGYAIDKWRTPPPQIKPGKPYTANDLVGKDIVMEGTHKASAEGFMTKEADKEIVSTQTYAGFGVAYNEEVEKIRSLNLRDDKYDLNYDFEAAKANFDKTASLDKEAMSLQGSGGIDTQWSRRVGPKILADQYCFAYKASKSMGFLAGLYSGLRTIGVDGMNTPKTQKGHNHFTGQKGALPVSPALATCASPAPEQFQEHVYGDGNSIENKLFEMDRAEDPETKRNAVRDVKYKQPFGDGSDGHSVRKWRHMSLTPTVGFSAPPSPAWLAALQQRGITATAPKEEEGQVRGRKDYQFQVPSEQWEAFKNDVLQNQKGHIFDLNGDQKNFIDLIEHRRKKGQTIDQDLDAPYYETVPLKGSQLMVYDDMDMPVSLNVNYKSKTTGQKTEIDYVLRDPEAIVDAHANPELGKLVAIRDAALNSAKSKTVDQPAQMAQAQQAQQQIMQLIAAAKSGQAQNPAAGAFKQALASNDEATKKLCLDGFREMAAHGLVPIAHTDVAHGDTCAPKLGNIKTIVPNVDSSLLPINHDDSLASPQDLRSGGLKKVKIPYCPPYSVKARKQQMGEQSHFAARWYEPGQGWNYGPLPEGVEPVQNFDGTSVIAAETFMYRGKPDGTVHKMSNGQWTKRNPNSKGSFIPGNLTDVALATEYGSSKGTDKRLNKLGHDRNGWVIHSQDHDMKEVKGKITTSRQNSPKPFSAGNLKATMIEIDGQQRPLSEFAFQQGGKVYFKDNHAAYQFLKTKLNFKDDDIGPFTRMTDQDLRIIDDIAADAIAYYEQVSKTPPEQMQAMQIDKDKYEHGKVCSQCGGETPPPEVMNKLAEAIENPHEAFQPKQGLLYGIKSAEGWITDASGQVALFGAQSQAQKALATPDIKAKANGGDLVVSDYPGNGQLTSMVPSLAARQKTDPEAELVSGAKHYAAAIQNYNNPSFQQPDLPQDQGTPEAAEFAQEADVAAVQPAQPVAPVAPQAVAEEQPLLVPQTQPVAPVAEAPLLQPQTPAQQQAPVAARTAAVQRLVRLANWLDDKGRTDEANEVDRLLREVAAKDPDQKDS